MDEEVIRLVATMQAQIDETHERLEEALGAVAVLAQSLWEVATALEWMVEENAKTGHMRTRVTERLALAVEAVDEIIGGDYE